MQKRNTIIILVVIAAVSLAIPFGRWAWQEYQLAKEMADDEKSAESFSEEIVSQTAKKYVDEKRGFTFDYPDNFTAKEFAEEGEAGSVVVYGIDGKNGFQLTVNDFEGAGPLTSDWIKKSAGELGVGDIQEVSIGGTGGIKGFSFVIKNPESEEDEADVADEIMEYWFVSKGKLFEISSYREFSGNMSRILDSWKFTK